MVKMEFQCRLTMWKVLPALLQYLVLKIGLLSSVLLVLEDLVLLVLGLWNVIAFKCLLMRYPLFCNLRLCFRMILWKSVALEFVLRNWIASPVITPLKVSGRWCESYLMYNCLFVGLM